MNEEEFLGERTEQSVLRLNEGMRRKAVEMGMCYPFTYKLQIHDRVHFVATWEEGKEPRPIFFQELNADDVKTLRISLTDANGKELSGGMEILFE